MKNEEVVPMAGIGPATSPLPRGCSTTEPHGHRHGFGHSRTTQTGIDTSNQKDLTTLERETGIEPVSLAWKAKVLPLNYSRPANPLPTRLHHHIRIDPGPNLLALVEEAGFEPAYA